MALAMKTCMLCAGFTNARMPNILQSFKYIRDMGSEDDLSQNAWQSHLSEEWQGSILVFTVPAAVVKEPTEAGLARLKLARLVQLLR